LEDALRQITLGLSDATRNFLLRAAKAYLPSVRGEKTYDAHHFDYLDAFNGLATTRFGPKGTLGTRTLWLWRESTSIPIWRGELGIGQGKTPQRSAQAL
jgi:hypothetical protein